MDDRDDPNPELLAWFAGRLPDEWFTAPPEIRADRDEILLIGELPVPRLGDDAGADARAQAARSRMQAFREDTRPARIRIAGAAERSFGRKVSWGVRCDGLESHFTTLAAPAMTRLRMSERQVLDTLIDASVAKSRSDALAWCVRLVGRHESDWLAELREALEHVEEARGRGPSA